MIKLTELIQEKKISFLSSDVLKLVGGTTIAQALTILTAPILSRIYSPDAFGTTAVFTSLVSIFGGVSCLRYEFAIMLPENKEDAANLVALSLGISSSIAIFIACLLILLHNVLIRLFSVPELTPYVWLIPIGIIGVGGYQAFNYWFSRNKRFSKISIALVVSSAVVSIVQLSLAILGLNNAGGLIIASAAGTISIPILLLADILRNERNFFKNNINLGSIVTNLVRYKKFPLIDVWGGLVNNLAWQLPNLILAFYFSSVIVGYFSLTNRLIQLPMVVIGNAISQVFFQRISSAKSRQENLGFIVEKVLRKLVSLGLFPTLFITLTGREWFVFVFGENWSDAGIYVQILGIWLLFWFISSPMSNIFAVLERQELAFVVHVSILASRIFALVIGGLSHNIFITLWLYSLSGIVIYGGLTIWIMFLTKVKVSNFLSIIGEYLFLSLPGSIFLYIIKFYFHAPLIVILFSGIVFLAIYLVMITRRDRMLFNW